MGRWTAAALTTMALLASPAAAAIKSAAFTTPASGSEYFYDSDTGSGSVEVHGTVTNANPSSRADLVCYVPGKTEPLVLASGVDVSSGTFGFAASLKPVATQVCQLALVPAGSSPSGNAAAPFAGPSISVTGLQSNSWNGQLYGYYILAGAFALSDAFGSAGECAMQASYSTDPATLLSYSLFARSACLPQAVPATPAASRSALQIDGQNAYLPGAVGPTFDSAGKATSSGLTAQPGFMPLTYTASFDAAHDTVTIDDTEPAMICDPPGGYPPGTGTCPSLHDSGVRVAQHTTLLAGDLVARVTQTITDVDGRAHQIDADFLHSVGDRTSSGAPAFQFPNQSSLATHATPDTFTAWSTGPQSIFVIRNGSIAPGVSNPLGAITFARPPRTATFVSAAGASVATLAMDYTDTLPAGGALAYNWAFSQASSPSQATLLEAGERDALTAPTISIRTPAPGLRTRAPTILVQGAAGDSVGIREVSVDGRPATLGPGGAFSVSVPLGLGTNTLTARAVNEAGNASTATVAVTRLPARCIVPRLRGGTVRAARRLLAASQCRVGRILRVHSARVRRGRIVGTVPRAGGSHRPGTKVRLILSRGR